MGLSVVQPPRTGIVEVDRALDVLVAQNRELVRELIAHRARLDALGEDARWKVLARKEARSTSVEAFLFDGLGEGDAGPYEIEYELFINAGSSAIAWLRPNGSNSGITGLLSGWTQAGAITPATGQTDLRVAHAGGSGGEWRSYGRAFIPTRKRTAPRLVTSTYDNAAESATQYGRINNSARWASTSPLRSLQIVGTLGGVTPSPIIRPGSWAELRARAA